MTGRAGEGGAAARRGAGHRVGQVGQWVLLSYWLPREPSTPRVSVWRKLDRLGVARLGDGLVGLPADARTREQVEWISEEIVEAGGSATVWLASPASAAQERTVAAAMQAARAGEYERVAGQAQAAAAGASAGASPGEVARSLRRLRAELRRITRRDFFPPPQRDQARAAVDALAAHLAGAERTSTPAVAAAAGDRGGSR
jgi:hypothetical protein